MSPPVTQPSEAPRCPYGCAYGFKPRCPTHRPNACGAKLECGGSCCIDVGHSGAHMCCGDTDGEPGSCPA